MRSEWITSFYRTKNSETVVNKKVAVVGGDFPALVFPWEAREWKFEVERNFGLGLV